MDHYFSTDARPEPDPTRMDVELSGQQVGLWTARGVFSWRRLDRGTALLIRALDIAPGATVLDLGCGYGPVAVAVRHMQETAGIVASDVNPRAVHLAHRNLIESGADRFACLLADGFESFRGEAFDVVALNPPIRTGWRIVFPLIDEAPRVVKPGGAFYAVAKTRQGAGTLISRIKAAFGNCEIVRRGSGYKVVRATKT